MKKIINNIPNVITLSRIISCAIGAILFTMGNFVPAICFYVYGAISDAFDGMIARKLNVVSEFGKRLDATSDKLFALSLMAPSIICGNLFMIIPFILEGIISAINIYSDVRYKNAHTEKVGKAKTIIFFPTMIIGLLATLEPYLFIAFVPLLLISLKLQVECIDAYIKQLDELKNNKKVEFDNNKINVDNNIYENKLNNIKSVNKTQKKTKKLVRKKEYNDRH